VPDAAQHLNRAAENELLARSLDFEKGVEVDWAIVMLFYSAVHYIDSVLAVKNRHPKDHTSRDSAIENHGTLSAVYNDYRRLKDGSREARYEIPNYHKSQFPQFDRRFNKIKNFITSL
jgi:uncharacterized protein (UPF0332 family)